MMSPIGGHPKVPSIEGDALGIRISRQRFHNCKVLFALRQRLAQRARSSQSHVFSRLEHEVLGVTRQGVWEYDAALDTVYHSPHWKAILGYTNEEVGNQLSEWLGRIHPDDIERVRSEMFRHWDGLTPFYESLHRIRHKDGHYLWVQDRGQVMMRAADGKPLRIIGCKMWASERQRYQEKLDQLAENVPGMLYQFQLDPDGSSRFPYASRGALDVYELTPEQLRHDAGCVFARIHPDDLQPGVALIQEAARSLKVWDQDYRVVLPTKGERWLRGYAKPQRLENGATLWHGYIHDVTDEKRQALKLEETERLLQRMMTDMPMALALVNDSGEFYFRNKRFHDTFGFPTDAPLTLDQWWSTAYPDPSYRMQVRMLWDAAVAAAPEHDGEILRHDYRVNLHDGSERIMAIGGLAFSGHFMATFEDRTEQQEQSERLHQLAYIDGLTGVPNRRRFDETLETEWRRCQRSNKPLSVLMVDIDHFKAYNDHYGHLAGDECLQAVAAALHAAANRGQDLVARYGGEEFVCLFPECDAEGALHKAEVLLQAIRALQIPHAQSLVQPLVQPILTVSIGVATCIPSLETSADHLLAHADANLYRAKQSGRNRVVADA